MSIETYSLWEHLKPEGKAQLKGLMPKDWQPPVSERQVRYPTLAECEENISKVIGEVSPAHTKGIR
ncbi:MAG: hypothetical protein PHI12_14735 [Dehalococcoidales bacterium]|nr:hypothetical protein [Dehalococcoidales bacterium]